MGMAEEEASKHNHDTSKFEVVLETSSAVVICKMVSHTYMHRHICQITHNCSTLIHYAAWSDSFKTIIG